MMSVDRAGATRLLAPGAPEQEDILFSTLAFSEWVWAVQTLTHFRIA